MGGIEDMTDATIAAPPKLKFLDIALYMFVTSIGIRWIAVAAAVGPASLPLWLLAMFVFFVPLAVATAELTARYEGEGGIYLWARDGIGPLAGFICGWLYWTLADALFRGHPLFPQRARDRGHRRRPKDALLYISISVAISLLVTGVQVAGLKYGKWPPNIGMIGGWIVVFIIVGDRRGAGRRRKKRNRFRPRLLSRAVEFRHRDPLGNDGLCLWGHRDGRHAAQRDRGRHAHHRARACDGRARPPFHLHRWHNGDSRSSCRRANSRGWAGSPMRCAPDWIMWDSAVLRTPCDRAVRALDARRIRGVVRRRRAASVRGGHRLRFFRRCLRAAIRRPAHRCHAILLQAGLMIAIVVLSQAGSSVAGAYDFLVAMGVLGVDHSLSLHVLGAYQDGEHAARARRLGAARRKAHNAAPGLARLRVERGRHRLLDGAEFVRSASPWPRS